MTLVELEELRVKAQLQCKHRLTVQLASDGTWTLFHHASENHTDSRDLTAAGMVCLLWQLAAPPKPATVTITVPFDVAERFAAYERSLCDESKALAASCREVISPYQTPK